MGKQLPKNWVESTISDFSEIVKTKGEENSMPYLEIGDINVNTKKYELKEKPSVKGCKMSQINDVLISKVRPTRGALTMTIADKLNVSSAFTILRFKEFVTAKLVFYQLAYDESFFNYLGDNCTGTMYPTVSENIIKEYKLNIPPLLEQKRIVNKLDTLFAQLETIKTSMANIPLLLKDFRQQVLTQAVTGKLTEEWRKGKKLNEWQERPLSDFSEARLGKMLDNAKNSGELVSYLGNINVRWSTIDFSDLKQMKVESKELHKYELLKGDILVCEGGEPGRAAIWKYDRDDVIFQKALHRIRLNKNVIPNFFLYNLKIDSLNNKLEKLFTGTTIKHLTGRSFSTYTILIPDTKEQQEIVRRVENLFAKADAIEQQYKTLKVKIETLPQAILHKAFKGELSEQLDTDGDARELMKQIQELKMQTAKVEKKKVATKAI